MRLRTTVEHRFVEFVPEEVEEGVLYVSIEYSTVVHKCCCGCGNQVVTPLSPAFWELTYDGESVTLFPSVGSWSFPCRSHYWIERNRVVRSYQFTDEEVAFARTLDGHSRREFFARRLRADGAPSEPGLREDEGRDAESTRDEPLRRK